MMDEISVKIRFFRKIPSKPYLYSPETDFPIFYKYYRKSMISDNSTIYTKYQKL